MAQPTNSEEPTLDSVREAYAISGAGIDFKHVFFEQSMLFTDWFEAQIRQAMVQGLRDGVEAIELVMKDPMRRRPVIGDMPTDFANDIEWAVLILKNLADELKRES